MTRSIYLHTGQNDKKLIVFEYVNLRDVGQGQHFDGLPIWIPQIGQVNTVFGPIRNMSSAI